MTLNIIEPIKSAIKEFHTADEFNAYYQLHKEEIDKTTTHKLNKLYHIDGYRITKIKNVLMLKKANEPTQQKSISELSEEITTMKEAINKIITFLNNGDQLDE